LEGLDFSKIEHTIPLFVRAKIENEEKYAAGQMVGEFLICDIRDSLNYKIEIDTLSVK
jgi:hypothetical protein